MSNSIAPIIRELEKAYQGLLPLFSNFRYYDYDPQNGSQWKPIVMHRPVITIQSRGKRREWGWFKPATWQSSSTEALKILSGSGDMEAFNAEICIAAEGLYRPTREILATLLHQMVHYACYLLGQPHQVGSWHTNTFKDTAWQVGLLVEQDGSLGFSKEVGLLDKAKQAIAAIKIDESVFDLYRKEAQQQQQQKKRTMRKWSCGCTNIRAAVIVHATCSSCYSRFKYADKDRHEPAVKGWVESHGEEVID